MRTSTATFLLLAVVSLVVGSMLMSGNSPAALPVLSPDGSPLIGEDGSVVVHRNMTEYYRSNAPAFALMGCSACLFAWCLLRAAKHLFGFFIPRKAS